MFRWLKLIKQVVNTTPIPVNCKHCLSYEYNIILLVVSEHIMHTNIPYPDTTYNNRAGQQLLSTCFDCYLLFRNVNKTQKQKHVSHR